MIEEQQSTQDEQQQSQQSSQSQPCILDFLKQAVAKYEEKGLHLKLKENQGRVPYCLYEDLKIMFEFAKQSNVSKLNIFKSLAKGELSHRSEESIRGRHKDFIHDLEPQDIDAIVRYVIEIKGIDGYVLKTKDNNGKETIVIKSHYKQSQTESQKPKLVQKSENKTMKDQMNIIMSKKKQHPELLVNGISENSQKNNNNNVMEEEKEDVKQQQQQKQSSKDKKQSSHEQNKRQSSKDQMEVENEGNQQQKNHSKKLSQPSTKINSNQQNQQQQNQQQPLQQQAQNKGLSEQEYKDARELDFYMTFLANYDNVQKKSLIHVLDKLSGDFNQVVDYLQTQNQNLLWKEDDDQVLRNFKDQTPEAIYLLKTLKKGKENILRRAAYLGIELPDFE